MTLNQKQRDRMSAMAAVRIDPKGASECLLQPPSSKCCDDRLRPPDMLPSM
jgi:hypothetical protein